MTDAAGESADAIVGAMLDGIYERNEQDFMRLVVRPGMRAADVGAHIGYHTRYLAELVGADGSVAAFEPLEEHANVLRRTTTDWRFGSRVRVVQAAVADSHGTRSMVVAGPEMAMANAYLGVAQTCRQVTVVTLDEAIDQHPLGFLKIDAEGAEALVLRGARRLLADDRPIVLVDLHPHLMASIDGTTPEALIAEMADLGYECRELGAGVPGRRMTDVHARGVTTVVFSCPEYLA